MGYRDDREALRQQVEALRGELDAVRGQNKHGAVFERLEKLARDVDAALERTEKDRDVLKDLSRSLEALRLSPDRRPPVELPASRRTSREDAQAPVKPPRSGSTKTHAMAWIVGALAVGALAFALRPRPYVPPIEVDPLASIPGAPRVDPLVVLEQAERMAPSGSVFVGLDAFYVADDGTLDLGAKTYQPFVRFYFEGPKPEAKPTTPGTPLGGPIPFAVPPKSTCFELDAKGFHPQCGGNGLSAFTHVQVARPTCSTRAVWDAARAAGAPSGAIARLTYQMPIFEKEPAWRFTIEHTTHEYVIADPGCRVVR